MIFWNEPLLYALCHVDQVQCLRGVIQLSPARMLPWTLRKVIKPTESSGFEYLSQDSLSSIQLKRVLTS